MPIYGLPTATTNNMLAQNLASAQEYSRVTAYMQQYGEPYAQSAKGVAA